MKAARRALSSVSSLAFDDFNRADGTLIGSTTVSGGKTWGILAGAGTVNIASGTVSLASSSSPLQAGFAVSQYDYMVQATVASIGGTISGAAIITRWTDVNNFLMLQIDAGPVYTLYKRSSGAYTGYGSLGVTATAGDVIAVRCTGATVQCYANGVLKLTVSGLAPNAYTVGLQGSTGTTVKWDNFSVLN